MEILAYYLPQYHATPHNDVWWGKGFTEWTNVAKAKKLFPGHYQPHIPADLGFYNLLDPAAREAQAELAKEAGITGFCYYHYWFDADHLELEKPFEQVVESGKPDFPFCLCWANESWFTKFWSRDNKVASKKLLVEQKYLGKEDNRKHFEYLLKAFKDPRYIKVDGRLLFVIYSPTIFENFKEFSEQWNELAKENGFKGFYFVGYVSDFNRDYETVLSMGFDAVNDSRISDVFFNGGYQTVFKRGWNRLIRTFTRLPNIVSYKKAIQYMAPDVDKKEDVFPTLIPNWDHSPRSGHNGSMFTGSTPELFYQHAKEILNLIKDKKEEKQIVFLKSWNEWGEGNYMEPDLKYGKGFIESLRRALTEFSNNQ